VMTSTGWAFGTVPAHIAMVLFYLINGPGRREARNNNVADYHFILEFTEAVRIVIPGRK
jgi:hypothetical protein